MKKLMTIFSLIMMSSVCIAQDQTQIEPEGRYLVGQFGSVTYVIPVSGGATRSYATGSSTSYTGAFTPSSVVTSRGTYVVVPNYTTGRTQAIIQTSRGR